MADQMQLAQLINGPLQFIEPEPRREPAPPSSGPLSGPLKFLEPEPPAPPPTPEQKRENLQSTAQDIGLSALAEAGRSVPSLMRGAAGSVERTLGYDLPTFGRNLFYKGMEKADLISPAEAQSRREAPLFGVELTPEQKAGNVSPYFGQPTFKGTREELKARPELFGVQAPLLAREAETPYGKVTEEAVMGGVTGLPGGLRTMAGRALTGAAAGAAGETAGQLTKGQENEPYWRLVSALGGGFLGAKTANTLLPAATARDEIADALLRDQSKGQLRMTPEQVRQAVNEGRPVTLTDMAGPETMLLIQKKAGTSSLNQTRLAQFNADMAERAGQAGDRVDQTVVSAIGRPVDADAFTQFKREQGRTTRDIVFGVARANPVADSIPSDILRDLMRTPSMQEAMRRADISAEELTRFNIKPFQEIPAVPAVESKIVQTPQGLRMQQGSPGRPVQVIDGNLSYWHKVDQKFGDMIEKAKREGENDLAGEYTATRNELRQRIYRVVPEYETALGVSRRTFQGESAPEAGFNFAQSLFSAQQNPFKRGDVKREFQAMPPENQEALRVGVAHAISQRALSGNIGPLANKFRNDRNFQRDMRTVLGDDRYYQIAGSVIAEDVLRRLPQMRPAAGGPTAGTVGVTAGLGAAAIDNLPNIIQMQAALPPETITKALIAAGIGAAGKGMYAAADRRVANAMMPMVLSRDPDQVAQLARLVEENAVARRVFNRMNTTLATAYDQHVRTMEREQERPARATGGAVNLKALAKSAKDHVTSSTEKLLNTDDDTVAKALEVANQHI